MKIKHQKFHRKIFWISGNEILYETILLYYHLSALISQLHTQSSSSSCLSNDPGKKESNFYCCGAIRFPHIEMFSFLRRECINLQNGCLRKKMYLNSTFKGCIFVLKHFDQSQELQTMAKKCSQFYMIRTYDFCVTQTRTRFCYKEVGQKKRD